MSSPAPATTVTPQIAPSGLKATLPLVLPAAAAIITECLVLQAFLGDRMNIWSLLTAHAAVVCLLALWIAQTGKSGRNIAMPLLTAIAVAAAGPIGAIAALVMIAVSGRRQDSPKLLADWYERIAMAVQTDDVTKLCEQVATGRTSDLTGASPRAFAAVMERGSLADRQTALGIIARSFHTDYLPALLLALKSSEPVIRVQAAAVATRVRGSLRTLVDQHAVTSETSVKPAGQGLTAAAQLDAAIASGLLDESDRIRAATISGRLKAQALTVPRPEKLMRVPILHRQAAENMLLRERRFADLRIGRRIAAVETARLFRVRRARGAAAAEAH
jgi:hypothetical protein